MAVYHIVSHPDPILREKAQEVKEITPRIKKLVTNMIDTLRDASGVGLAAPQIGVPKRVLVVGAGDNVIVLINPEIVSLEGEPELGEEGCLSLPGLWGKVNRAPRVTVRGYNLEGKQVGYNAEGLASRAFQHEVDHLDGILFIDRAVEVYKKE
ncbi:MAG: peptide deformylase [Candidatus Desulforudis sp.]|nr:peptide deformylase [Desulforudis sp.]